MLSIVNSNFESLHLTQLYNWYKSQWKDVDPFTSSKDGHIIPSPILAVEGEMLLGGLAFTRYKIPDESRIGLWINAVFVKDEYRGKGIGSQLIDAAKKAALYVNEKELFALTDIPEIYQKMGWVIINQDTQGSIVRICI